MEYSRRDFLRMSAAGLPLVAGGVFFAGTALGMEDNGKGAYNENKAENIHRISMEKAIREAGEDPEEVKQQVRSRMLELRGKASEKASV